MYQIVSIIDFKMEIARPTHVCTQVLCVGTVILILATCPRRVEDANKLNLFTGPYLRLD